MAFEVEVKAHVDDPLRVQTVIEALALISAPTPIDKDDWYFSTPGQQALFRLRREAGRVLFTRKRKRMDGDIEANEEFEFETDEGQFDRAVALKIIDQHIKHCVRQAFTEGEIAGNQKVDEIIYLIDKYLK